MGRGGAGLVVTVLVFNTDDPSLKPDEAYSLLRKILLEKEEETKREAGVGPFEKAISLT